MINSITLLGSSSGRNAGDAALISGIMESIDEQLQRQVCYEIPTIKPKFVRESYPNIVRPVSMLPWSLSVKMLGVPTLASILRTDLSLVFDAILFDRALFNPLFNFLSTLYLMLPAAKRRGKKLGCFNVGAGPVNTPLGRRVLRQVCELMDFITVRDDDSLTILKEIGVSNPNIVVTADAALNVQASSPARADELLRAKGFKEGEEILAINLSAYLDSWASKGKTSMGKERFLKIYAAGLNRALKELNVPLLFVSTQYHDVEVTKALMELVTAPVKMALISNRECSHYDIKAILSRVSLLFAMRLHAVILACSEFSPAIALPHQPKVVHFLRTLGLEDYALSFDDFSEETISRHLLKGWKDRSYLRETLTRAIPVQKERAKLASRLVLALSEGRDPAEVIRQPLFFK
jgi:polysaccharide pyruvyl transferase WcaK-like protein